MRFEGGRLLCLTTEREKSLLIIGVAVVQPAAAEKRFADVNQLGIDTEMCFAEEGIEGKDGTSHHSHERPDDTEQDNGSERTGKLRAVLKFIKPAIPAYPSNGKRKQPEHASGEKSHSRAGFLVIEFNGDRHRKRRQMGRE